MIAPSLTVTTLRGLPMFTSGMSVGAEIVAAAARSQEPVTSADVIVIAQKIVSKAEGRLSALTATMPRDEALRIARETGRDPALIEHILAESTEILRAHPAAIIARHRTGHVLANAGIDASNIDGNAGASDDAKVLLWPVEPDASARAIRDEVERLGGVRPAVIIADSMGRAWRIGTVGTAIGCAGIAALDDRRGQADLFGRTLQATIVAIADSIAAMAGLVIGEGAEGTPVAIVRGAGRWVTQDHGAGAAAGLRPIEQDMFR